MPCLLMKSKYDLKGKNQVQHTIALNKILYPPEKSPIDFNPLCLFHYIRITFVSHQRNSNSAGNGHSQIG